MVGVHVRMYAQFKYDVAAFSKKEFKKKETFPVAFLKANKYCDCFDTKLFKEKLLLGGRILSHGKCSSKFFFIFI